MERIHFLNSSGEASPLLILVFRGPLNIYKLQISLYASLFFRLILSWNKIFRVMFSSATVWTLLETFSTKQFVKIFLHMAYELVEL